MSKRRKVSKQKHDIGRKKREHGQKPISSNYLSWMRVKRRHPGPLPTVLRNFGEWLDAGKPKRFK